MVEVTSPRSHLADLEEKAPFYLGLGIPTYLVIDAVTPSSELRQQIELHLWRLIGGQLRQIQPESEGWLALPEMGLKVLAQRQRLGFADAVSSEVLFDTEQLITALQAGRQARLEAESRAKTEAESRRAAEVEIARLRALLAKKEDNNEF